jgi:hypothetical protein
VAWSKICRPKEQGGLGVLNLTIQNKALLLKNLHKFYNKHDIPCVNLIWSTYYSDGSVPEQLIGSFWWKSHIKLIDYYKGMARCNLGDGNSVNFLSDLWSDQCLDHRLPHLLSVAKSTRATIQDVANAEFLEDLFHLPLSQEAHSEFAAFEEICNSAVMTIAQGNVDSWS